MISRQLVTKGLGQMLATGTGRPVGYGAVPIDPATGQPVPPPYTLLYPIDRTDNDNTLADNAKAIIADYQATFVSGPVPGKTDSRGTVEQAQWLADKGERWVMARPANGSPGYTNPINIPGVNCYRREASGAGGTPNSNDAIITEVIRFRLYLEATA